MAAHLKPRHSEHGGPRAEAREEKNYRYPDLNFSELIG